jgi:hypothetical protein
MLKHTLWPLLCGLLCTTLSAQVMPLQTTNGSELGVEVSSYRYEETLNGAFFMATEGNKVGLNAAFSQALGDDWFWGGDIRQSHGNVSYSSASSGTKGGNPDIITEIRITGGRDRAWGTQVLSPYFGLGYRMLFNDLRGYSTTGAAGYRRISHYTYLPLGVTHRLRLDTQTRLSTTLEYDLFLEGRQQSFLSDINAASNDPTNTQREGYGVRLMVNYETLPWSVGLFVHHWNIADSDLALQTLGGTPYALIMEPRNTTREVGLTFKLRFQ